MLIIAIAEDVLQIGSESVAGGVFYFNIAVLLEQHCLAGQAFMPNGVLLQQAQCADAAR